MDVFNSRSRVFDGYLSKVSGDRKEELNKLLTKELEQFFRMNSTTSSTYGKLQHFIVTQKNSTKYFEASEFRIHYKNKIVRTFDERPKLYDLHSIVNKNRVKGIIESFNSMKISIPSEGGEKVVQEKFFNCLEGILYDDVTDENYWRVSGEWYQVSVKYTVEVYTEYIRVLKSSLLDVAKYPLEISWPLIPDRVLPVKEGTNKKTFKNELEMYKTRRFIREGDYNNLYIDRPSFIVTDAKVVQCGIEISDLFQWVPNSSGSSTIYLYHVKKVFGADGYRSVICQILCSAHTLHNALNCAGGEKDSSARLLFDFIQDTQNKSPSIIRKYANYAEFREQLRSATFVFSPIFETGERELDKDYMALTKYDFNDFGDEIEPSYRHGLNMELHKFLLKEKFIHSDGEFTTKWFEACSVPDDVGFRHVRNEKGLLVDSFPGKEISNLKPKDLRKLLKRKYYKTVDALSTKLLIVQMSEALHNMGFGFKICQIEGEEDKKLHEILDH